MSEALLLKTIIVIVASAVAVGAFTRLKLSPILGYLVAGVLIGPHGFGILSDSIEARFLAELGVIFLMFMAGLELGGPAIQQLRHYIVVAGALQVGITIAVVSFAAVSFGVQLATAVIIAGAVAMSSTALTLKQLAEQGELATQYSRVAVGILLFQDFAALPFLVAVGVLGDQQPSILRIAASALTAGLGIAIIAVYGRPAARLLLGWVARARSAELFLLSVLLLALGTAFMSQMVGLAAPVGAFLAGLVVGESDFRHQIADDVRPFRDVLVGLFFVTIGMTIDPTAATAAPMTLLAVLVAIIPGKALLIFLIGSVMRWPAPKRVAVILAHGGELGLVVLSQGLIAHVVNDQIGQSALLGIALTMGLAPVLIQYNSAIAAGFGADWHLRHKQLSELDLLPLRGRYQKHVVICGCGRIGRLLAMTLKTAGVPYVGIESDIRQFRRATRRGYNVVFGDPTRKGLLEAVNVSEARVVAITFDHLPAVERVLYFARQLNSAIFSVVSANDDHRIKEIIGYGADLVLPENFAAGLELATQVLLEYGDNQNQISETIAKVRRDLSAKSGAEVPS
jgi:monovalent cation:H+ antiporter-2, CPA2 family